jgi:DNA-binding transcriptional regulator YhcF (GntR family)
MRTTAGPSVGERLYQVIKADVEAKRLPAGALLPASERVAGELVLEATEVRAAYARLQSEGLVEEREDGRLCISGDGDAVPVGDATQIRFEAALLKAVREAAARGLSSADATGMFKAAMSRMEEMAPKKREE